MSHMNYHDRSIVEGRCKMRPSDYGEQDRPRTRRSTADCPPGKGGKNRRKLPAVNDTEPWKYPMWMEWQYKRPEVPGWYWACSPGMWPQCVELRFEKGKLVVRDRHEGHIQNFWQAFAGPIPDPVYPTFPIKRGDNE